MTKGDWPTSYVVPSIALSAAAAGFLAWHTINPAAKVDGWSVALLVIFFLPWLRTVFESIDFPGGGSVKFRREVKAEQERQAKEIEAMRFLLARFLTKSERALLQQLERGEEIRLDNDPDYGTLQLAASLRRIGMIAESPGLREKLQRLDESGHTSVNLGSVGEVFVITESGRRYLDLVATLPDEIEQPASTSSTRRTEQSSTPTP
ncbi:hypothetical protein [Mycobacteroides abscessus]|uniref:hypothetical protein n=1 Tax=Mycobacteroides abscessus TaxID=36809 RepID=UPI000DBB9FB0|nr:hypothetical protein [Mycobacteroides abscessus]BBB42642.1 hypothetical protein MASB_32080 [Mycobacteroides abscessus subsp. bolletii BD]